MPENRKPWEIHPELTSARLQAIASIIREVREEVVAEHRPSVGDGPWALGCRAYERTLNRIRRAATSAEYGSWLTLVDDAGLHLVFAIGGVPLRLYRTDSDEQVPSRALRRFHPEIEAQQLAFEFFSETEDLFSRLAIETDEQGLVSRVLFLQTDSTGAVYDPWSIPLNGGGVVDLPSRTDGVVLPPPPVDLDDEADEAQENR